MNWKKIINFQHIIENYLKLAQNDLFLKIFYVNFIQILRKILDMPYS